MPTQYFDFNRSSAGKICWYARRREGLSKCLNYSAHFYRKIVARGNYLFEKNLSLFKLSAFFVCFISTHLLLSSL